jgi:hypothetical protein
LAPAIGCGLLYLFVASAVYPAFEPSKSGRPLAEKLVALTAHSRAQGIPVLAYEAGNIPRLVAFYSNGLYLQETSDPAVLARHLSRPEGAWALVDGDRLGGVPDDVRRRLVVVMETRLARRPVLVVTNRDHADGHALPEAGRVERE